MGDDDKCLIGVIGCNFFEAGCDTGVAVLDAFAVGYGFVNAAFFVNTVGVGVVGLGFGAFEAR